MLKRHVAVTFVSLFLLTSCGRTTPEMKPTSSPEIQVVTPSPEIIMPTPTPEIKVPSPSPEIMVVTPTQVDHGWKTYQYEGYGFDISVPDQISILEDADGITLFHTVRHEHPNPCDFRGTGELLEELTDFEVRIEVVNQGLFDAVGEKEYESFASEYVVENEFVISPGFIDEVDIGFLHGYRITMGVEGCGAYMYYFPFNPEKTLYVKRSYITEFMSFISNYQDYLALPGIIPPTEEEDLFNEILAGMMLYE
jgi:hypothetical protein